MENFTTHYRLFGDCGQETFLASHVVNGVKEIHILKKIECADENFANLALRELVRQKLELEEIPGTIPAKEFEIYWETKNSSIYICLLRDFYHENLMADLQRSSINRNMIKEKIVEDYLCQLILILEKCHKRNVFHRSIKPSNIVKNIKMKNLFLVDFEVEGTTQYNIYKVWQPPELGMSLQEPPDREKIDIWGIGAVMLSIVASTSVEPGNNFEELLLNIKEDTKSFDELYEKLKRRYSEELIDIIRSMLNLNPQERPTIKDLKKEPFLEAPLKINDTETIKKNVLKCETGTFFEANIGPVLKGDGTDATCKYLAKYIYWDERVIFCLVNLNKVFIYQNRLNLQTEDKKLVLAAMKTHLLVEKVQVYGFQLLQKLISKSPIDDYLYSCEAVLAIISIIKVMSNSDNLKPVLYEYLTFLALSDLAAESFGSHGGVHILIAMMKDDKDDMFLLEKSCQALWSLCTQVCNAKIAAYEGIPAYMCSCLKKYSPKRQLEKELITVLFSLSSVPNVIHVYCKHNIIYLVVAFLRKNFNRPDIIALCCNTLNSFLVNAAFYDNVMVQFRKNCILDLLVSLLWDNLQEPDIIQNCLVTLASIIADDEESAYGFLITNKRDVNEQSGMRLIRKILNTHRTSAEINQNACNFLDVLVKFDEGCHHARTHNILNWLLDIKNTFLEDQELQNTCNRIIRRLKKISDNI